MNFQSTKVSPERPSDATSAQEPVILYIAGYGRSGSTLVDRLLGASPRALGCGEIAVIFQTDLTDFGLGRAPCPCGQSAGECIVWGSVLRELGADAHDSVRVAAWESTRYSTESLVGLWRILLPGFYRGPMDTYRELTRRVIQALWSGRSVGNRLLIDSSKSGRDTIWRPIALKKLCGYDVRVVHVVRDPRGVLWSEAKFAKVRAYDPSTGSPVVRLSRQPMSIMRILRVLVGWTVSNIGASLAPLLIGRRNYVRINYETLASRPSETIGLLARFSGAQEPDHDMRPGQPIAVSGHQLHGNRMRFEPTVTIKLDTEWQQKLGRRARLLALCMTWPCLLAYSRPPRETELRARANDGCSSEAGR